MKISKYFLFFILFLLICFIRSCHDSNFYMKEFFNLNIENHNHNIPCVYSGLLNVNDKKINFFYIKSRLSTDLDSYNSKNLIIWLEEIGKSYFNLLLNFASPFKMIHKDYFKKNRNNKDTNEKVKIEFDDDFIMNLKSDLLFLDFPGNIGFSEGWNENEVLDIDLVLKSFNKFMKEFYNTNLLQFVPYINNPSKFNIQSVYFISRSWLATYLAFELMNDSFFDNIFMVKKVALLNAKYNSSESKEDYLIGLGILRKKQIPHYLHIFNSNKIKVLNEYIDKIAGDIDTSDMRSSVYDTNNHLLTEDWRLIRELNKNENQVKLNILTKKDLEDINHSKAFIHINNSLINRIQSENIENIINNVFIETFLTIKKNAYLKNQKFHIYYLTGKYDLDNTSIDNIDNMIPSLSSQSIGHYKLNLPSFSFIKQSENENDSIIKGYIKQNDNFTFIMFKNAGKNIPLDDKKTFDYFLLNNFLDNSNVINDVILSSNQIPNIENKSDSRISCVDGINSNNYKNEGGCIIDICNSLDNCNGNGICNKTSCKCSNDYVGVDCSLKIIKINQFDKLSIPGREVRIFEIQSNLEFILTNNLLIEIDSNSSDFIISVVNRDEVNSILDFQKHLFFQKLHSKQSIIYLDKEEVSKTYIVVNNLGLNESFIVFNLFNYDTKATDFFSPQGFGFIFSLIIFCIGISFYISVHIVYKNDEENITKLDITKDNSLKSVINLDENNEIFNEKKSKYNPPIYKENDQYNVNEINDSINMQYNYNSKYNNKNLLESNLHSLANQNDFEENNKSPIVVDQINIKKNGTFSNLKNKLNNLGSYFKTFFTNNS